MSNDDLQRYNMKKSTDTSNKCDTGVEWNTGAQYY